MKAPLKSGDRVRVYATHSGAVSESNGRVYKVRDDGMLIVLLDHRISEIVAHPKQCRRLVKKPRERVWVRGSDAAPYKPLGDEWVEFVEVRRPKK